LFLGLLVPFFACFPPLPWKKLHWFLSCLGVYPPLCVLVFNPLVDISFMPYTSFPFNVFYNWARTRAHLSSSLIPVRGSQPEPVPRMAASFSVTPPPQPPLRPPSFMSECLLALAPLHLPLATEHITRDFPLVPQKSPLGSGCLAQTKVVLSSLCRLLF